MINIQFRYAKGFPADPIAEGSHRVNINRQLSEFAKELIHENAVVECRINEDGSVRLTFRNISAQLHKKVVEELNRFEQ
ncbi:MAG: hypothetical protein E6H09_00060 [Bacteroidetes bacterium]|jgi:hypothetical protein|nr:MAG: hypothetical protein E6H09_00060 [Bacteroidota bacterium]